MAHQVRLGTISHGTLRTEDLLQAFASEYERLGGVDAALITEAYKAIENTSEGWATYDPEDASELVNSLQDALGEHAPPYCYFGSIEGDGADFGFWPDMERLEEAMRYESEPTDDDEELTIDDGALIVHINDHGNVTLMDSERNVIWSAV